MNAGGDAAPQPEPRVDAAALIETWWNDHFPGSVVAQMTACWNHAHAAKEDLKQRLAALLDGVK